MTVAITSESPESPSESPSPWRSATRAESLIARLIHRWGFVDERDYQLQLDDWFRQANARTHKTLRCRPIDRLAGEREHMSEVPAFPDLDRRWVTRVPVDPFLRVDTNDYSLDPRLAGRRGRSIWSACPGTPPSARFWRWPTR